MNIALHVPELVESHKLRSYIDNVSLGNYLNSQFSNFKSKCISDAAVEQSFPKFAPGIKAGSPGSWCDDNGLHMARGREEHS